MKNKRTKAVDITNKAREAVRKRDRGFCILCGKRGLPSAHFVSRAQNGLGIEENLITLCFFCHDKYDNSVERPVMQADRSWFTINFRG